MPVFLHGYRTQATAIRSLASRQANVLLPEVDSDFFFSLGSDSPLRMAAEHSANMFKLLEKQGEIFMETYRSMSHELHKLQVEEEMLMQKLYKIMTMEGLLNKEKKGTDDSNEDANKSLR